MRIIFFMISSFCFLVANAQKKVYNTHIDTATNVTINGGKTTILKADSVFIGQLTINQNIQDSVYFLGSFTTQDTSGIFTTSYKFAPRINQGSFNVDIKISFDKEFTPWYTFDPPTDRNLFIRGKQRFTYQVNGENGGTQTTSLYSEDFRGLRVRGLVMADAVTISVKSKTRLHANISGAAAIAK